jgi:hypothetical protein
MTIADEEVTSELTALQQLPEPDREAEAWEPICATTGLSLGPLTVLTAAGRQQGWRQAGTGPGGHDELGARFRPAEWRSAPAPRRVHIVSGRTRRSL